MGPAPHQYRCFKYFIPSTHKEWISDTVQLIPHTIPIPSLILADHIAMTADTLVSTLQHYSTASPLGIKLGDPVIQGVKQISDILKAV